MMTLRILVTLGIVFGTAVHGAGEVDLKETISECLFANKEGDSTKARELAYEVSGYRAGLSKQDAMQLDMSSVIQCFSDVYGEPYIYCNSQAPFCRFLM